MSESWKDLLTSDAFKKRGRIVYRVKISEEVRYASSDGNHAYLKELLSTGMVDPNYEDNWLVTPLNAAIRGGHLKVANLLLEAGADPDIANKYGITPLMIAVYGGYSLALVFKSNLFRYQLQRTYHNIYAEKEGVGQTLPGEVR